MVGVSSACLRGTNLALEKRAQALAKRKRKAISWWTTFLEGYKADFEDSEVTCNQQGVLPSYFLPICPGEHGEYRHPRPGTSQDYRGVIRRDDPKVASTRPFAFCHYKKRPRMAKEAAITLDGEECMDPTTDVHVDNVIAIRMSDEDVGTYGRRFDLAQVCYIGR